MPFPKKTTGIPNVDHVTNDIYSILNRLKSGGGSSGSSSAGNPIYLTAYCRIRAYLDGGSAAHPAVCIELSSDGGESWTSVLDQAL